MNTADPVFELFAACPRGLEPALARELAALGAGDCRAVGGGVLFTGDRRVACLANLWSRLASRVMRRVAHRRYRDDDDLYRLAAAVEWERCFDARQTLRVDLTAMRSPLRSLNFATLRIKDGIVDRLRERTGERPSIDTRSPGVRVFAHLEDRDAVLYLDLSGEPLFKRGWRSSREDKGAAPLKENLAAGLLAVSGWTPAAALYDPFCGSGTIAIEAAQIALDIAPGISRRFGFENLLDHDATSWGELREHAFRRRDEATRRFRDDPRSVQLAGSDIDPDAIGQARRNALQAGVPAGTIAFQVLDASRARAPFEAPGYIVTNPPYGARLDALPGSQADERTGSSRFDAPRGAPREASQRAVHPRDAQRAVRPRDVSSGHERAMRAFGERLKRSFDGWHAWILSSDPQLPRQLDMKERRRTPLYNGAIECRLFGFRVFGAGSRAPADAGSAAERTPAGERPARSVAEVPPPQSRRGRPSHR